MPLSNEFIYLLFGPLKDLTIASAERFSAVGAVCSRVAFGTTPRLARRPRELRFLFLLASHLYSGMKARLRAITQVTYTKRDNRQY